MSASIGTLPEPGGIGGALRANNNLADVANPATARSNLGLAGAATLAVGTTSGTVAAGDDTRLNAPALPVDHGLIAWTMPLDVARDASLLSVEAAAGTLRLTRIRRIPPSSITNLHVVVTTAGSGLTAGQCFGALYSSAGALIAQTADQATPWASAGVKTMALAGGPYVFAGGDLYVGLWYNGTTAPQLARSGLGAVTGQATFGQSSGSYNASYANTGLTTTAPGTIGAQSASLLRWWAAVS